MSSNPTPSGYSRLRWTSNEGLAKLKDLLRPLLHYEPRDFQLHDSACILDGQDVFCITATGDGKSALIFIPVLIVKEMITVVVEPTNFLEDDLVKGLKAKDIRAVVINADTLHLALQEGRSLWKDATAGLYQVIALAPETLNSPEFNTMIRTPSFRARWGTAVIDEAHLVDQWGANFRKAFEEIWTLRARAPEHTVFVALSASVEPGHQEKQILHSLGFREDNYYMDRRDCERHNIDYIFRDIRFPYSGYEFRDLDWLVPVSMENASDLTKRLVYCPTIEMGHRVVTYLRSLLPAPLQKLGFTVIRHLHSMNCSDCKADGLKALYQVGAERETGIFVTTAVCEVGLNIPGLRSVVMFPSPKAAASLVQFAGRPAREANSHGEAIVYVKKTDLDAAKQSSVQADLRGEARQTSAQHVEEQSEDDVFKWTL